MPTSRLMPQLPIRARSFSYRGTEKGTQKTLNVERIACKSELLMRTRYTVSDGKLVLNLETAEEGGYIVTSPLDPELITEACTFRDYLTAGPDRLTLDGSRVFALEYKKQAIRC